MDGQGNPIATILPYRCYLVHADAVMFNPIYRAILPYCPD
jgi:hypothetical protein